MFRKILAAALISASALSFANSGAGQTVEQIYYCGEDFAMRMSGGEWYVVQKSRVGEQKLNHLLSMAMFMMASGKKTANVFPGEPLATWCGNANFRPITIFSVAN